MPTCCTATELVAPEKCAASIHHVLDLLRSFEWTAHLEQFFWEELSYSILFWLLCQVLLIWGRNSLMTCGQKDLAVCRWCCLYWYVYLTIVFLFYNICIYIYRICIYICICDRVCNTHSKLHMNYYIHMFYQMSQWHIYIMLVIYCSVCGFRAYILHLTIFDMYRMKCVTYIMCL